MTGECHQRDIWGCGNEGSLAPRAALSNTGSVIELTLDLITSRRKEQHLTGRWRDVCTCVCVWGAFKTPQNVWRISKVFHVCIRSKTEVIVDQTVTCWKPSQEHSERMWEVELKLDPATFLLLTKRLTICPFFSESQEIIVKQKNAATKSKTSLRKSFVISSLQRENSGQVWHAGLLRKTQIIEMVLRHRQLVKIERFGNYLFSAPNNITRAVQHKDDHSPTLTVIVYCHNLYNNLFLGNIRPCHINFKLMGFIHNKQGNSSYKDLQTRSQNQCWDK